MPPILLQSIDSAMNFITHFYEMVFPEYPFAGLIVVGLSVLLLVVSLFRAEFGQAVKTGVGCFILLTVVLAAIHQLGKLLALSGGH